MRIRALRRSWPVVPRDFGTALELIRRAGGPEIADEPVDDVAAIRLLRRWRIRVDGDQQIGRRGGAIGLVEVDSRWAPESRGRELRASLDVAEIVPRESSVAPAGQGDRSCSRRTTADRPG